MSGKEGDMWRLRKLILHMMLVIVMIAGLFTAPSGNAAELTVAAAADLNFAFTELVGEFEKQTGEHVKLSLGSSGNFYSQIQNGAPFDLYFSADISYPEKLISEGLALPGSLYQYATGRIVLWVSNDSKLEVAKGIDVLLDPSIRKIAIANPKHSANGRAAVSAMEHAKVYDRVKDKFVLGENVLQTAQSAQSGAADIGIIALSLALAPSMQRLGTYWIIPQDAHPPINHGAAIVAASKNQEGAKRFLVFLKTPASRAVLQRYGFILPGSDVVPPLSP